MENVEILQKIVQVVKDLKGSDGWTDLALIGKPLTEQGVNYKALGYMKLRELLEEYPDDLEVKRDETSYKVPVLYVKEKLARTKTNAPLPTKTIKSSTRSNQAGSNLMSWAWMGDYRQAVNDLKNMALKERWYYKTQNPSNPFPILSNYLI